MSRRETYETKSEKLIMPILQAKGFELVDVEYIKEAGNWFLRFYIDKEGGITIDDCESVSRAVSEILDKEDYIDDAYIMEVSSPGLGRPLKKEKDFIRNKGKEVEIKTFKAIDKQKEFSGILCDFDKDNVTITDEENRKITFKRSDIALIRQALDLREQ